MYSQYSVRCSIDPSYDIKNLPPSMDVFFLPNQTPVK